MDNVLVSYAPIILKSVYLASGNSISFPIKMVIYSTGWTGYKVFVASMISETEPVVRKHKLLVKVYLYTSEY
jgi:hypothetical protein